MQPTMSQVKVKITSKVVDPVFLGAFKLLYYVWRLCNVQRLYRIISFFTSALD